MNSLLSNPDNDIHYMQYKLLKIWPATKAYNGPNTIINILIYIIKMTFIIYIVRYIYLVNHKILIVSLVYKESLLLYTIFLYPSKIELAAFVSNR